MEAGDQTCIECDDDSAAWFRVLGLAAAILAGCFFLVLAYSCYRRMAARGAKKEAGTLRWVKPNFVSGGAVPLKIYGKIVVSHYQILTQFPVLFDIAFPSIFQDWLDALAVLSLDLYTFLGIHCVADINLYAEFAVTVTVPAVGLLLIYLCYRGWLSFIVWKSAKATQTTEKDAEQGHQSNPDDEAHTLVVREARNRAVWLAIGWLFLVYTILCRTTFRSFACQTIDEGESFHQTDYTIDCNSNEYKAYAVAAAIFICIYPVGIPSIFGFVLYWNRWVLGGNMSGGQNADKWWYGDSETLDFLVDGYRRPCFWFELVDFMRKLLMAGT